MDPLSAPLPWPEYDDAETLWSNDYAREFWSGGITPLHYSIRGGEFAANHREWRVIQGLPGAAALPFVKYRRGTVYMNDGLDEIHRRRLIEAPLPERLWRLGRMQRAGCGPLGWISAAESFGALDGPTLDGLPAQRLAELTDAELVAELVDAIKLAEGYNLVLWFGFFVYAPWSMALLGALLERAAPDGPGEALADILGGPPETSAIAAEREALWELGRELRRSPELLELVCSDRDGPELFRAAAELPGGRAFLAHHEAFLATYGAGGQADRDFFNPRRAEDPDIDRRSLRLAAEAPAERDPKAIAERLRGRRRSRLIAIRLRLLARPWSAPLLPLLLGTVTYVDRFWKIRDDQRWAFDRLVMRKKRACLEAARRLVASGRLAALEDAYFMTKEELAGSLLRGEPGPGRSRLDERRAGFDAMQAGTEEPPHRLLGSSPLRDSEAAAAEENGAVSLAPGEVEGKARVIRSLTELMDLRPGEILVCRAVDPGWAAAFFVADGLVLENGGPQSFGATLARGAGIPAVLMHGATSSVRSGATIKLDGSAGTVRVQQG